MTNDEYIEALRCERAVIGSLLAELKEAEDALLRKGYIKECSIPACNCGPQWNHGGHAEQRLREISDALPYVNGKTLLESVQDLVESKKFSDACSMEDKDD